MGKSSKENFTPFSMPATSGRRQERRRRRGRHAHRPRKRRRRRKGQCPLTHSPRTHAHFPPPLWPVNVRARTWLTHARTSDATTVASSEGGLNLGVPLCYSRRERGEKVRRRRRNTRVPASEGLSLSPLLPSRT